jgi:hypothetical protein
MHNLDIKQCLYYSTLNDTFKTFYHNICWSCLTYHKNQTNKLTTTKKEHTHPDEKHFYALNLCIQLPFTSKIACVAQWLERRTQRSDDPCVESSSPTVRRGCRSFGWDHINRDPVSQQVWHVKELSQLKAISAKSRSKFAVLSPVMVTAAR